MRHSNSPAISALPTTRRLTVEPLACRGAHITVTIVRDVDLSEVVAVARSLDLLSTGYAWIGCSSSFLSTFLASDGGLPGWLYLQTQSPPVSARRLAFDASWPNVSLRYNQALHGVYDPATGLPFFGPDVYSATIWDTDYAPVGDGKPDYWGSFVYDTVWIYAEAVANVTSRGLRAADQDFGTALVNQLLRTDLDGITGKLSFDLQSQDRLAGYDLMNVQVASLVTRTCFSNGTPTR